MEARALAGLSFWSYCDMKPCLSATSTLEAPMLWTIFVVLLALWLLGIVSANTFGGFIHVLLWLAIAVVLVRVLQGRRQLD